MKATSIMIFVMSQEVKLHLTYQSPKVYMFINIPVEAVPAVLNSTRIHLVLHCHMEHSTPEYHHFNNQSGCYDVHQTMTWYYGKEQLRLSDKYQVNVYDQTLVINNASKY
jgi:hypothetical protein